MAEKCVKSKRRRSGLDQAARLVDVVAQHFAQRGVEQVRGGVRAHYRAAAVGVYTGCDGVAHAQAAVQHLAAVQVLPALGLLDVGDGELRAVRAGDDAVVGDLAAHLGVEGGFVEDYAALRTLAQLAGDFLRPQQWPRPCRYRSAHRSR